MRVVIADDDVLLREGLARIFPEAGFEVVGHVGDATALLQLVATEHPDVAIVDIRMPPTHTDEGLRAATEIRARFPQTGVVLLSQHLASPLVMQLLRNGGRGLGYLLKDRVGDVHQFVAAIRRVALGGSAIDPDLVAALIERARETKPLEDLSGREREILALMAEGRSNQAIGAQLFLGGRTVETHIRPIFSKLGLPPAPDDHRRVLAVLAWLRGGAWRGS